MANIQKSYKRLLFALIIFLTAQNTLRAQTPVASFTADKITGCAPLSVNFTNTSTGAISYKWNFGNTNTSFIANPSTVYLTTGTYTVTLVATSAGGQRDTARTTITVVVVPVADFTSLPLSACQSTGVITFTNSSSNAVTYLWDFGDGSNSSSASPTHIYQNPGTYNIRLIATNSYGCQNIKSRNAYITILPKPSAQFTVNTTSSCDISTAFVFTSTGTAISNWNWSFGDGTFSTQQNPTHHYSSGGVYSVSLIVTNANGCEDTIVKNNYISIGSTLVPSFVMSDTAGCGPLPITFTPTVSNATSWSWNFGDGTTSILQNPSHTYNASGNYSITLTVTTQSGCNGTVTVPGLVVVDPLPVANFSVVQDTGCKYFQPQFINNSSNASTYFWSFGNGDSSTLQTATTTYPTAGSYNVTLHAYSPNGCHSVKTINNAIRILAPSGAFTGTPTVGCPGTNVQYTSTGNPANITSYNWNFGDGTFSSLQNPSHIYNAVGSYIVWCIVTNSFGCKDTVYKRNYIKIVSGTVPFTPDTVPVCQGEPLGFSDPTEGSNAWNWDLGDGSTSTIQNPTHIYNIPGFYTATLNTSMPGGCSQAFNPFAIVHVIPYDPKPIDINYINRCKPYTVSFSTATPDIVQYLWTFGDGDTATIPIPTHVYDSAGTYAVSLTMTIGAGCITTINTTVTFGHPNPMSVNSNDICKGDISQFTLNDPAAFVSYTWLFGDGQLSTTANPTHTYATIGAYIARLVTLDTIGCRDTFRLTDIIVNDPVPLFSSNTSSCLNATVQFQNNSLNATSYHWDFGDGTTSTDTIPSHTYITAGLYTITLTATSNSCSKTLTQTNYITVFDPLCDFTFVTNGQCLPVTATFTDVSPTAVTWLWNFGDTATSTLQNPVHTYADGPTGPIQLTITDSHGCTGTTSKTNITYYSASGSVDSPIGCAPHNVQFTDHSNGAIAWEWILGDGNISTLQSPSHTYSSDGIYTVILIATFPGNCVDTIRYTDLVTVNTPVAEFFSPTIAGCSPTQILFNNQAQNTVSYLWDFGDGGSSTNADPSHVYYIPGDYTVTLIATNGLGCTDTLVKPDYIHIPGTYSHFLVSETQACITLAAIFTDSSINASSWLWNFGDGFIDSIQNPVHTYLDTGAYIVTLITKDSLGCSSTYTYPTPILIYPAPVANASITDTLGCSDFNATFTNLSQYASSYLWLFGDGDSSTQSDPAHIYLSGGIYHPVVVAITQYGCQDTFRLPVDINVLQTPDANITASDTVICDPSEILFSSSSALTQNPSYAWIFGNGSVSNNASEQIPYAAPGTFTSQLIVTNNNGCADTTTLDIIVNPSPVANATVDINEGCEPLLVQFTDHSTGAILYHWNFGNGDTSNAINPPYNYLTAGIYNANLIVENQFACIDTFIFNPAIAVHAVPVASITPDAYTGCTPATFTFSNSSANLENPVYNWDFGDGSISTLTSPSHAYTIAGTYNIRLQVANTFGCNDDTTITITVYPSPTANGSSDITSGCSALSVNFNNVSMGADSYLWSFGDGVADTTTLSQHTYLIGGIYQPQLIAVTNNGCRDTFALPLITVKQSPTADFDPGLVKACAGESIQFTNLSTDTINSTYDWNFGFYQSNLTNPLVTYFSPGTFDVTLVATNGNGCTDTLFQQALIEIFDTLPPPVDSILSVSVLNDTEVIITWKNSSVNDLGSYRLYRYNNLLTDYELIFVDTLPANATQKPSSSFTDTNLDCRHNTYTYKIQTADFCHNMLLLNSSVAHTTINVTAQQSGQNIDVSWTPYGGCSVATYELWRTEVSNGSSQLVATVPSSVLNYHDTSLTCPFDYSYRIKATELSGSAYFSESDTSVARPENILANQLVEIIRSTVVDNRSVLTEWLPPAIHPERAIAFQILRSTDNINFFTVGSVPAVALSYLDNDVNVQSNEYYYHIVVVNDCSLTGPDSKDGSSILLKGDAVDYTTRLKWTPYKEWQRGVDNYVIERQRIDGTWEPLQEVDGTVTETEFQE